ncbi:glutamate--tRNA ligase [Nitratifractor sp.]|uniref:glutamate--tRNA ligase n=1 Tax=Nitratifractor sp. TaxID=2268144 RepID=UPI0025E5D436|nr:glutamate--tRNA ligase [Nitratifractor sp.]
MLRYALLPRGDLSIESLRIALINYLVARQRNEGFILRIEDTDKARIVEGKEGEGRELLEKFAIHPDQTLYQSDQLGRYQHLAVRLVEEGRAFLCLCSEEELEQERRHARAENRPYRYSGRCARMDTEELRQIREEKVPFTIRLRKPATPIRFTDLLQGDIEADPGEVDHFVILRADGTPTSDFAAAVDDMIGGISLIIDTEERLRHTPRQIHVRQALGFDEAIAYAHLPPLLDPQGKRLSETGHAGSVKRLLEEGFLPDAILNYLLLLGNETPMEIFTLPEAVEWFDLRKLSRSPTRFDLERLRQINREHLRRMEDRTLSRIFGFADADVGRLAKLYLEEAATINELESRIRAVFAPKSCRGDQGETMQRLSALILAAPYFDTFDEFTAYLSEKSGLEGDALSRSLRHLMTGAEKGPDLGKIYQSIKSYITEVIRCQP